MKRWPWKQSLSSGRMFMHLPGRGRQVCVFQNSDGSYGFSVCGQDQPGQWESQTDAMAAAERLIYGVTTQ